MGKLNLELDAGARHDFFPPFGFIRVSLNEACASPATAGPGSSWFAPRVSARRGPAGSSSWPHVWKHKCTLARWPPAAWTRDSLVLGDPLHCPEGLRVADVAGQRLHQCVFDVYERKVPHANDTFVGVRGGVPTIHFIHRCLSGHRTTKFKEAVQYK